MTSGKDDSIFKALADHTRRTILDLVKDGPKTTGDLCHAFPKLDRCTVMMHLSQLENAELVIAKRQGRYRWNYLNVVPVQNIYERWISQYAAPSAALLTRISADLDG